MNRELPDEVLRGQVYYADLDPVIGSEQGGNRPVLVIQNNIGNRHSPTIIIAPITTRVKKLHCAFERGEPESGIACVPAITPEYRIRSL